MIPAIDQFPDLHDHQEFNREALGGLKSNTKEDQKRMDYKAELENLKNSPSDSDYWSPEPGQYKVVALGEIEESEPYEDDKEQKPRRKLRISINNEEHTWTFPKGKKESSVYGQLIALGSERGKLKDESFTIIVVGKEQDRRYTIVM